MRSSAPVPADQTRTVFEAFAGGADTWRFEAALATREREPDAPNYTPRISGLLDLREPEPRIALAILSANAADPERTDRHFHRPAPPPPGLGLGLTTYAGDGDPLPSFRGDPLWLPLEGRPEAVLERSVLHESFVGGFAQIRDMKGSLLVTDHSEVRGG